MTPTSLSDARDSLAATTVGNYALFGGGISNMDTTVVDAYNHNLTRSTPTQLSVKKFKLAATTVGNYALFAGGFDYALEISSLSNVDAYNESLTRSTPTSLSVARGDLAATTVGNYALFVGGEGPVNNYHSTVDAYNTSLTRSILSSLSVARGDLAATTVGDYALFGGGSTGWSGSYYSNVDACSSNLIRTTATALSVARDSLSAATVGDYALFGGGRSYASGSGYLSYSTVDAYNSSLTRTNPTPLSSSRYDKDATSVGNYVLFGGDHGSQVDAYYLNNKVQVYPGTKYKLGNMSSESIAYSMQMIETTTPITGYIKIKNATIN